MNAERPPEPDAPARDAMRTQCPRARTDETIQPFVGEKVLGTGQRCFLVTDGETLLGLATLHELRSVPWRRGRARRSRRSWWPWGV